MTDAAEFVTSARAREILVYDDHEPAPAPAWEADHVRQGFAWRPHSVAFRIPDLDGRCLVRVGGADLAALTDDTIWAFEVPFVAPSGAVVVQAGDGDAWGFFPESANALVFKALPPPGTGCAFAFELAFVSRASPEFRILRSGGDVPCGTTLRVDAARPA